MKKLTVEVLERAGACAHGVERFAGVFPKGTFCSKRDIVKWEQDTRIRHGILWANWAAGTLLSLEGRRVWQSGVIKSPAKEAMRAFAKLWRAGFISPAIK